MQNRWMMGVFAVLSWLCLPAASVIADDPASPPRPKKLRVLVDKVISRNTKPKMTDAQVREIKEAGFNVVVPRWGGNDMARVREVARLARRHGIFSMTWNRGSVYTSNAANRFVYADGSVQEKLCSPNADELWAHLSRVVLGHARISLDEPSLIATFLDFENYDKVGRRGNCYSLSYDETILRAFAKAKQVELPSPIPKDRGVWLKQQKLDREFAAFQIESWRRRCRTLRQAIDAINPAYQLVLYPAPGTPFLAEAALAAWATERAPVILADASTYARPMTFLSEADSLAGNRAKILDHVAFVQRMKIPFLYLGGIDPIVKSADPEFSGKNADVLASTADGYWVFYEGPTYGKPDHRLYFDAFARANRSIAEGTFSHHREPRRTSEHLGPEKLNSVDSRPVLLHEGVSITLHKELVRYRNPAGSAMYDVRWLEGFSSGYLAGADVVIVQSSTRWRPSQRIRETLRGYVKNGGGLFITHPGWAKRGCSHPSTIDGEKIVTIHGPPKHSIFPGIASWVATDATDAEAIPATTLIVAEAHPALGELKPGTTFTTDSPHVRTLHVGPAGHVLFRKGSRQAVGVVGKFGKGRVAVSGCFYGDTHADRGYRFSGVERDVFYSVLAWLTNQNGTRSPSGRR